MQCKGIDSRRSILVRVLLGMTMAGAATSASGEVTVEKAAYGGWENCYRITNGEIEAVVTSDVGPRVIRFGRVGGPNEFRELSDQVGKTGGDQWRLYGGHRLWHAPEGRPRTYAPDNDPIEVRREGGLVRCIQSVEPGAGMQKEIALAMDARGTRVRVVHRLTNRNLWPVETAPWAISALTTGGCAILPLPSEAPDGPLLPNARMALWPYANLADPRYRWGQKHIVVVQDAQATSPSKIGLLATDGWGAYFNGGRLFVKTFDVERDAEYPDMGCSLEVYNSADLLELETLAPLKGLGPGETAEHVETWHLFDGVLFDADPTGVEEAILPLVKPLLGGRADRWSTKTMLNVPRVNRTSSRYLVVPIQADKYRLLHKQWNTPKPRVIARSSP